LALHDAKATAGGIVLWVFARERSG
jgi:hypothetical protein